MEPILADLAFGWPAELAAAWTDVKSRFTESWASDAAPVEVEDRDGFTQRLASIFFVTVGDAMLCRGMSWDGGGRTFVLGSVDRISARTKLAAGTAKRPATKEDLAVAANEVISNARSLVPEASNETLGNWCVIGGF